jgi:hypothetical protein
MGMIDLIIALVAVAGGGFSFWVSGRCRGRNARRAFHYAGWGALLLLLWFVPIGLFPWWLGILNYALALAPSTVCFLLAVNSILKEMRAQKESEYTEAA